jgi:hypothetical protein
VARGLRLTTRARATAFGRTLTAYVAAYAVILHAVLMGLASTQAQALPTSAFEILCSDHASAAQHGGGEDEHRAHIGVGMVCALCAGGHAALGGSDAQILPAPALRLERVEASVATPRGPPSRVALEAIRPRGPPLSI